MAELTVEFDAINAAAVAGRLWRRFRDSGGVRRDRIVPDFPVGAHALERADALPTRDRGFYRRYVKGLQVVEPGAPGRESAGCRLHAWLDRSSPCSRISACATITPAR
jgi:hypothetical protein